MLIVPWVQDWSFSIPYELEEVRAQIDAARISGAKGYMLWNAQGLYTDGALDTALTGSYGASRSLRQPSPSRTYRRRSWSRFSRWVHSSTASGTRR